MFSTILKMMLYFIVQHILMSSLLSYVRNIINNCSVRLKLNLIWLLPQTNICKVNKLPHIIQGVLYLQVIAQCVKKLKSSVTARKLRLPFYNAFESIHLLLSSIHKKGYKMCNNLYVSNWVPQFVLCYIIENPNYSDCDKEKNETTTLVEGDSSVLQQKDDNQSSEDNRKSEKSEVKLVNVVLIPEKDKTTTLAEDDSVQQKNANYCSEVTMISHEKPGEESVDIIRDIALVEDDTLSSEDNIMLSETLEVEPGYVVLIPENDPTTLVKDGGSEQPPQDVDRITENSTKHFETPVVESIEDISIKQKRKYFDQPGNAIKRLRFAETDTDSQCFSETHPGASSEKESNTDVEAHTDICLMPEITVTDILKNDCKGATDKDAKEVSGKLCKNRNKYVTSGLNFNAGCNSKTAMNESDDSNYLKGSLCEASLKELNRENKISPACEEQENRCPFKEEESAESGHDSVLHSNRLLSNYPDQEENSETTHISDKSASIFLKQLASVHSKGTSMTETESKTSSLSKLNLVGKNLEFKDETPSNSDVTDTHKAVFKDVSFTTFTDVNKEYTEKKDKSEISLYSSAPSKADYLSKREQHEVHSTEGIELLCLEFGSVSPRTGSGSKTGYELKPLEVQKRKDYGSSTKISDPVQIPEISPLEGSKGCGLGVYKAGQSSQESWEPDPNYKPYPGMAKDPRKVKKDARYQKKFYRLKREGAFDKIENSTFSQSQENEPNTSEFERDVFEGVIPRFSSYVTERGPTRSTRIKLCNQSLSDEREAYHGSYIGDLPPTELCISKGLTLESASFANACGYDCSFMNESPKSMSPVLEDVPTTPASPEEMEIITPDSEVCRINMDQSTAMKSCVVQIDFNPDLTVTSRPAIYMRDRFYDRATGGDSRNKLIPLKPVFIIRGVNYKHINVEFSVEEFLSILRNMESMYYRIKYSNDSELLAFGCVLIKCRIPLMTIGCTIDDDYELVGDELQLRTFTTIRVPPVEVSEHEMCQKGSNVRFGLSIDIPTPVVDAVPNLNFMDDTDKCSSKQKTSPNTFQDISPPIIETPTESPTPVADEFPGLTLRGNTDSSSSKEPHSDRGCTENLSSKPSSSKEVETPICDSSDEAVQIKKRRTDSGKGEQIRVTPVIIGNVLDSGASDFTYAQNYEVGGNKFQLDQANEEKERIKSLQRYQHHDNS